MEQDIGDNVAFCEEEELLCMVKGQDEFWEEKKSFSNRFQIMKKQKPSLSYLQKQGGHLNNVNSDSEIYHKKKLCLWSIYHPQCINKIVKTV